MRRARDSKSRRWPFESVPQRQSFAPLLQVAERFGSDPNSSRFESWAAYQIVHTKHRVPKRVGMTCGSFSGSGSECRACALKLRRRSYGVCRTSGGYSTVGEIAQSGRAPISKIGCRGFDSRSYTSQSRWQLEDVKAVPGNHPGAGSKRVRVSARSSRHSAAVRLCECAARTRTRCAFGLPTASTA